MIHEQLHNIGRTEMKPAVQIVNSKFIWAICFDGLNNFLLSDSIKKLMHRVQWRTSYWYCHIQFESIIQYITSCGRVVINPPVRQPCLPRLIIGALLNGHKLNHCCLSSSFLAITLVISKLLAKHACKFINKNTII